MSGFEKREIARSTHHLEERKLDHGSLAVTELEEAKEIAGGLHFDQIFATLKGEGFLQKAVEDVQSLFSAELGDLNLSAHEWEMFSVLWLYDEHTAEHCIMTYKIAEDKIERTLPHGLKLKDCLELESVTLQQFYRACLFHDIGKIGIPRSILNNEVHESSCAHIVCQRLFKTHRETENYTGSEFEEYLGSETEAISKMVRTNIGMEKEDTGDNAIEIESVIQQELRKNRVRPHSLPAEYLLEEKDMNSVDAFLLAYPELGLSRKSKLAEFIGIHEALSSRILKKAGMDIESQLVGNHHNPSNIRPMSSETLRGLHVLSEVLKFSDITQALSSNRVYREALPLTRILEELVYETEKHTLHPAVAYFLILDEMEQRKDDILNEASESTEQRLQVIDAFLAKTKDEALAFFSEQDEFRRAA